MQVAPYLAELSSERLIPSGSQTLHVLAARGRKHFLPDLTVLVPVILALGGKWAAAATAQAVEDAGRWFP